MTVLSPEQRAAADAIVAKYPNPRSAMLPLLFLVQSVEGHVTDAGMREVAAILDLTPAQVLASASFYTMLKKRPQGDYLISVCRNISCTHLGARKVIAAAEEHLGIDAGGTTSDGRFSLEAAECLGTCDGAPSAQINYEDFYRVTPADIVDLIERIALGDDVRSVRGELVKTSTQIAHEIALAGVREGPEPPHDARTVGGESPATDMATGFRPRVEGETDA